MFENLRTRWNASRQRRFQERAAKYLRRHFAEVVGLDETVLGQPGAIDALHEKYFGRAA